MLEQIEVMPEKRLSVSRIRLHAIRAILTSEYWLIVSLSGAFFFFFALNRGGVDVFIRLASFFLIINLLLRDYRTERIPVSYVLTAAICAYLSLASVLVSPQQSHTGWMVNLARMLGVIFAMHCLSQKKGIDGLVSVFFPILLSLVVCWQFVARYLFNMPYGTFTNLHYLATFAVLAFPMIIYFSCITTGWYKLILVPIAIMDAELLLRTGSGPAIFGITCAALFVIVFLTKGCRKWIGMALLFLVFGALYVSEYADAAPRIEELIVNLAREERVQFWTQAWNNLKDNSVTAWVFGHGIGWFPVIYVQDSTISRFVFPHCHFLEILYLNGLVGVVLVFGGFTFLFFSLIGKIKETSDKRMRTLLKCMLVVFLSWLIHSGLALPFYSRYSLCPLAFILAAILVLLEKATRDEAPSQ